MTINSTGTSILCFAVQENKPEIVSHLLSLGANPDYGGLKSVTTPLIEALHRYEPKLVRILLKAGANPNFVPEGSFFTPLIKASLDLDGYLVRQLLDFGVDVNQKNSYGSTALMSAVFTATRKNLLYRESKAVQRMLEAGAIGEGILESQFIAFAHLNDLNKLQKLLEQVDIDSTNYYGHTALMEACSHRRKEAVIFLLSAGVNPNIVNYKTALTCAIYTHDLEIVRLLLESGADLNLRTNTGDTAWSCSQASTPKMRALLSEYVKSS